MPYRIHKYFERNKSFRRQLLTLLVLGITVLTLSGSIFSAWVASNNIRNLTIANSMQATTGLAEQSYLALLTASEDNATDAIKQIRGFNSVQSVAILHSDSEILVNEGFEETFLAQINFDNPSLEPVLYQETESTFTFLANVVVTTEEDLFSEADEATTEVLGKVVVRISKKDLISARESIFTSNLTIGVVITIVLVILMNFGINRLTSPIFRLSSIMQESERTGQHLLADIEGPKEVQRMAESYNAMMRVLDEQDESLRQHRDQLESQVELRTRELVTARDAALTASRHKSEFLANVTHELRTPLQSIIGYIDLLKEDLEIEGFDDYVNDLDRVTNNAVRLLSLINSILNLAKIEAGRMDIKLSNIALNQLVHDVKETVNPLLSKNSNQLVIELFDNQYHFNSDQEKLHQILVNLTSNAIKFTEQGQITIRSQLLDNGLQFSVIDTGIGMTAEQTQVIFDEFRQVDGSEKRKFEGTGLGLAICQRFASLMNGVISVTSEPGKGSTFTLLLPIENSDSGEAQKQSAA